MLDLLDKNSITLPNVEIIPIDKNKNRAIQINSLASSLNPIKWLFEYKNVVQSLLDKYGAILLRNFNIHSVSEFNHFAKTFSPKLMEYEYCSTPRSKLGGQIYTATEYPAYRNIFLHNENAYTKSWPATLLFFCVIPPDSGGQTPIASSIDILKHLDKNLVKKYEEYGVKYIRHYFSGIDLAWQDVFNTESKEEVEAYCKAHDINYQWLDGEPMLVTDEICQATLFHPRTQEKVWFNQAHLFHPSSLSEDDYKILLKHLGGEASSRNVTLGDGSHISDKDIKSILSAYNEEKILFSWEKGDLLIVDNISMAHGRTPFFGERKIAVAMC